MTRLRTILVVVASLGLVTGCETLGQGRRKPPAGALAGDFEPASPVEGGRGRADSARPPGAWSSDAADIEKHLNHRSADPNW